MYKLNETQINNILKLRMQGKSMVSIAKELDVSNETVKKYLLENNYKIDYFPSDEEIKNMIKFYNLGLSINQLHIMFNRKGDTISKHLKEKGIVVKKRKKLTDTQVINVIIEMYKFGMSMQKIENVVKVERHKISDILKDNNIFIRDNTQYTTYNLDDHYFDILDTPNKAYILGFLYADGNVGKDNYIIQIALQSRDVHILNDMKKELKTNKPLFYDERSKINNKHQDIFSLSFKSKHMHESLCKLGVFPQKTHEITYPNFLKDGFHKHFLRGVMDGDGCIHIPYGKYGKNKSVDICGTKMFCDKAKEIIESKLDIHCSVIKTSSDVNKSTYRITVSGGIQASKFLDWLYEDADLKLNRKYQLYLEYYCKNKNEKKTA